jgi:glycerophosphoryl diester phosphodiesterase
MGRWRPGGRYAENSIPAFLAALGMGADGIEFDVQLTADGEAIVHHDQRLGRTTDVAHLAGKHMVCDLPAGRLTRVGLKGQVSATIPTLGEVMEGVAPELGDRELWVELKRQHDADRDRELVARVVQTLAAHPAWPRVVLRSFDEEMLVHARGLREDARLHALTVARIEHAIHFGSRHGFEGVAIFHPFAQPPVCRQARRAGLTVTAGGDPPNSEVSRLLRQAMEHRHIDHITADDLDHALAVRRELEASNGGAAG